MLVYRVIFVVFVNAPGQFYSGAIQITDCIALYLLPRAPVSAVGTAFVSCRHICLIIRSHSVIFCFVSQINLI